jgi:hypothetical protein
MMALADPRRRRWRRLAAVLVACALGALHGDAAAGPPADGPLGESAWRATMDALAGALGPNSGRAVTVEVLATDCGELPCITALTFSGLGGEGGRRAARALEAMDTAAKDALARFEGEAVRIAQHVPQGEDHLLMALAYVPGRPSGAPGAAGPAARGGPERRRVAERMRPMLARLLAMADPVVGAPGAGAGERPSPPQPAPVEATAGAADGPTGAIEGPAPGDRFPTLVVALAAWAIAALGIAVWLVRRRRPSRPADNS